MATINILPKEVYNRISAGEVIERPASIIKELYENAIDADAKEIIICIENGGIDEIFFQDDGTGVESSEFEKIFMPHATSKISRAEDLNYIQTLGFRGEALASIGAVSHVRFTSKTADAPTCTQITCEGGLLSEPRETRGIDGTAIIVSNLFYNTPARLSFLKTPKGEEREVTDMVQKLALSTPFVAVKYYANSKLILETFGDGLESAIVAVYGKEAIDNCYKFATFKNGLYIEGYTSSANYYKGNRTYQTLFLNGRYITDTTISSAIQNAYNNYLMKRQYPFYVINMQIDPTVVDVNVHPRKAEVRFTNNRIIYASVYSVISTILDGSEKALEIVNKAPFLEGTSKEIPEHPPRYDVDPYMMAGGTEYVRKSLGGVEYADGMKYGSIYSPEPFKEAELPPYEGVAVPLSKSTPYVKDVRRHTSVKDEFGPIDILIDYTDEEVRHPEKYADDVFKENKAYIEKLEAERNQAVQEQLDLGTPIKFIGQALGTYLIQECGNDLIFIDQHAAHERVLFDKYYQMVKSGKVIRQALLLPYKFNVNALEAEMVFEMCDLFRELGFVISYNHDNVFALYEIPVELADLDIKEFLRDILTDDKFKDEKIPTVIKESIAQKACKAAIKSGDQLTGDEVDSLMASLKQDWNLKCPHGRPIAIKISRTEIDKWFKRIV